MKGDKMITKLRGPENIMHRYKENPIITVDDFPVPARLSVRI